MGRSFSRLLRCILSCTPLTTMIFTYRATYNHYLSNDHDSPLGLSKFNDVAKSSNDDGKGAQELRIFSPYILFNQRSLCLHCSV